MKDNIYWLGVSVCAILVIYLVVGFLMLGHCGIKECGMDLLFLGITLILLIVSIGFIVLCDRI